MTLVLFCNTKHAGPNTLDHLFQIKSVIFMFYTKHSSPALIQLDLNVDLIFLVNKENTKGIDYGLEN